VLTFRPNLNLTIVFVLATNLSLCLAPAFSKDSFDKGRELQGRQRFSEAIVEYHKALQALERSKSARRATTAVGNFLGKATSIITFGDYYHVSQKPNNNDILDNLAVTNCNLGVCYFAVRNFVKAEYHLRQALKYDFCVPHAHYYLGCIQSHRGNFKDAISEFEQEPLSSRSAACCFESAVCYEKMGQPNEARKSRKRAAEIDSSYLRLESVRESIAVLDSQDSQNRAQEKAALDALRAAEAENFRRRMNQRH